MEDLNLLQIALAAKPESTTVEIRKNGDAVLVVAHKRFVVSKEILQVTSDYFKTRFSPSFLEGQAAPDGSYGDIVLHDDDPDAMETSLMPDRPWWKLWGGDGAHRPHAPGVWLIYFTIASLPLHKPWQDSHSSKCAGF